MVRIYLGFVSFIVLFLTGCKDKKPSPESVITNAKHTEFIPVTQFILGELYQIDSLPVTPLRVISENGHSDSQWVKKSDMKKLASDFLDPIIDSQHLYKYFKESSFLDQTINFYTFSYEAKSNVPADIQLTRYDVYVDPKKNTIDRVFLIKTFSDNTKSITTEQLTWRAGNSFKINYITELPDKKTTIKEEEIIWNFTSNSHN